MIATRLHEFAADVRRDLALEPRQLQSKYLYDALGSSLFEAICRLPWYPITRAELRLLRDRAAEIVADLEDPVTVVELGCGSGEKLAVLAEAMQAAGRRALVHLIDISAAALEQSEQRLGRLEHVSVIEHRLTYEDGLRRASRRRLVDGPMLVLLLGSNIGNFDRDVADEFLREIRHALEPGDAFLLGADLVKDPEALRLAYDDPLGVTAAFNKNLLARLNRELDGDFDLGAFDHEMRWNADLLRVEMHLVSRRDQTVRLAAADLEVSFREGESIWTESSHKYRPEGLVEMGVRAGFRCARQWVDGEAGFALTLLTAS